MLFSFQDLVQFFGLKPKAEEKEVASGHFFMLWFEFCADFKARWKRENKTISKERYVTYLQLTQPVQLRTFILRTNVQLGILEMFRNFPKIAQFGVMTGSGCSKSCCWGLHTILCLSFEDISSDLLTSLHVQTNESIFFLLWFLQTETGSAVNKENHWRKEGGDQKDQPEQPGKPRFWQNGTEIFENTKKKKSV